MPPIDTTTAVSKITITRTQDDPAIRPSTSKGRTFWLVESKNSPPQDEVAITLKNHAWQGANPNFTTMAPVAKSAAPATPKTADRVSERKNHRDATACVRKYFTLFSSWSRDPLAVSSGKNATIFSSSLAHSLNQLLLIAPRTRLVAKII